MRKRIALLSDNAYYREIDLELAEVEEVWRVSAKVTQYLPCPRGRAALGPDA